MSCLQNWEKMHSCSLNHPIYGTSLWQEKARGEPCLGRASVTGTLYYPEKFSSGCLQHPPSIPEDAVQAIDVHLNKVPQEDMSDHMVLIIANRYRYGWYIFPRILYR